MADQPEDGLHLIVIGAGLAGLAAALSTKLANPSHKVTILETVKELQEVGAGIQVTPNGTRLLAAWGLADILRSQASIPTSLSVQRYDGTKLLAHEPNFQESMMQRYGHGFWDLHRGDLQRAMANRCLSLGATLQLNSRATSVDFDTATVTLSDGRVVEGDVVLLTDGLWSTIRSQFVGKPTPAILTGDLAYRITLSLDDLSGPDAEFLTEFVKTPRVNFWVGPNTHAVGYSISAYTIYNLVFLCPDDLPLEVTKQEGDLNEMRELFKDWDPLLQKFLGQLKTGVHKWKLMWLESLPKWANEEGTFYMAGDCCHPMLPYLAQGANSSLEDGAVLGHLLGKVNKKDQNGRKEQLKRVAEIYQKLRMERGRQIQLETFKQRDDFHMEDGEQQEKRDELMMSQLGKELKGAFPSRWTCPEIQPFLYGYDAYKEAERAYQENPF
ncbi:hypothetical protein QBC46DRAFT_287701 [Diplogelasinospora grovesii]|uniref:FAD-binding domain-containing protein n=1 Tax=Diplogelasinospora grovesii TaxID=303347 RepID=A0AAN6S5M4_9PEZI|nr:hypothetical protein QBC46DRAFT_287701 [Diplogelasinospora grovesii]